MNEKINEMSGSFPLKLTKLTSWQLYSSRETGRRLRTTNDRQGDV